MRHAEQTQLLPEQMSPTPPEGCPFVVGDVVLFTNEYDVEFPDRRIVGFTLPGDEFNGRTVYLEKDAYWFPVPVSSLSN